MTKTVQQEANNLAIASLVLGILSLFGMGPLTGIPAIITGFLALKNPASKGMAVAGIVMGSISVVLILFILFFVVLFIALGAFATSSYDTPPAIDSSDSFDSSFYQQRA